MGMEAFWKKQLEFKLKKKSKQNLPGKKGWVPTMERVEKRGMESYVFEENVESVGSDKWGPQTGE